MKKDILFRNTDLIKLALDDLVDQRCFFRKILRRERLFSGQIDISPEGQNGTGEEGEEITHPPHRSSSPVRLSSHSTCGAPRTEAMVPDQRPCGATSRPKDSISIRGQRPWTSPAGAKPLREKSCRERFQTVPYPTLNYLFSLANFLKISQLLRSSRARSSC